MRNLMIITFLAALVLTAAACGPRRPVVYPDEKVKEAGEEQVRADVEDCLRQAKEAGIGRSKTGEVAKTTAVGAGTGAAIGAAVGAFGSAARPPVRPRVRRAAPPLVSSVVYCVIMILTRFRNNLWRNASAARATTPSAGAEDGILMRRDRKFFSAAPLPSIRSPAGDPQCLDLEVCPA